MEARSEPAADHGSPGTAEEWSRFLERRLNSPVDVVFGRSRSYPVQVRIERSQQPKRASFTVRMHSMFASAPPEVADSVASWIRSGRRARRASTLLDRWIEEATAELPKRRVSPKSLVPRGQVHDLERLSRDLLAGTLGADFAGDKVLPGLTWGRRGRSQTRRSLRLGSFDTATDIVRVHPVLDQAGVPEWFVRYVLFHELLHAAIPPVRGKGTRWVHHGPEFRRREHAYPDYARAALWEEKNLPRLIRSARSGKPLRVRDRIQGLFSFDS